MKNWLLVFSACMLLLGSCNNTIPVGPEILPEGDGQLNLFNDTTTLVTSTVLEDSLRSDRLFLSQLGVMNDPIFGQTKSSLMIGFRTPSGSVSPSIFDSEGGYSLDSVVLSLAINSTYGDTTNLMGFKVYKLPTPLNEDDIYYSNIQFNQGMVEVGELVGFAPRLSQDYTEDSTYQDLGSQIRIKLNSFFGQSIINILETDLIESNELLHQFLPGLVIVPTSEDGSIMEIDMLVSTATTSRQTALEDSRLQVYYKNAIDTSLNIIFPATVLNLGIGKYDHDYNGTNVESALNLNNPQGDEVNYIQGLAGVKTKIEMPNWANYEGIAIRKAELVVTQAKDGFENTFLAPDRLVAVKIGSNNENENTSDFNIFQSAHTDGFGTEKTLSNGEVVMEYRINVSDQLQRIAQGEDENTGFFITVYAAQDTDIVSLNSSDLIPDRIVIGGGKNTIEGVKLKLDLAYTILN